MLQAQDGTASSKVNQETEDSPQLEDYRIHGSARASNRAQHALALVRAKWRFYPLGCTRLVSQRDDKFGSSCLETCDPSCLSPPSPSPKAGLGNWIWLALRDGRLASLISASVSCSPDLLLSCSPPSLNEHFVNIRR